MQMKDFFNKYNITDKDFIIIACSWWSDSMYLTYEIAQFFPKSQIILAHFNHQLRWEESNRDENFIINTGFNYEIWSFDIYEFAKELKIWIEEAARIKRYEFLEKISQKYWNCFIFTGHHLDDSIETFFFNILRWTKLKGLIWIEEKNWKILRPLLKLTKSQILEKCAINNIDFINDSSNEDAIFLRNYLRLEIIPKFQKINPGFKVQISNLMEYFNNLSEYLNKEVQDFLDEKNYFVIDNFLSLDIFLQKEIIAHIFKKYNNWTIWLSEWNIKEVLRFINDKWNYTIKEIKKMRLFKKNWKIEF